IRWSFLRGRIICFVWLSFRLISPFLPSFATRLAGGPSWHRSIIILVGALGSAVWRRWGSGNATFRSEAAARAPQPGMGSAIAGAAAKRQPDSFDSGAIGGSVRVLYLAGR